MKGTVVAPVVVARVATPTPALPPPLRGFHVRLLLLTLPPNFAQNRILIYEFAYTVMLYTSSPLSIAR